MTRDSTGCGCALVILGMNLLLGYVTFSYCVWVILGKTEPWWVNMICGLIGGEVTVPLSIIFLLLGIHGPLVK